MFRFPLLALTEKEANHPHAYAMAIYKDAQRALALLRMIYWPQNAYCIHVDMGSSKKFFEIFQNIAKCYPNIILAKNRVNVQWGKFYTDALACVSQPNYLDV